jgi:hypothetical protein
MTYRRQYILDCGDGFGSVYLEKIYRSKQDRRARARIEKRKADRAAMRDAMQQISDHEWLMNQIEIDDEYDDPYWREYDEYDLKLQKEDEMSKIDYAYDDFDDQSCWTCGRHFSFCDCNY